MAALTPIAPALTGTPSTPAAAAAGGDTFVNDGKTYLRVTKCARDRPAHGHGGCAWYVQLRRGSSCGTRLGEQRRGAHDRGDRAVPGGAVR